MENEYGTPDFDITPEQSDLTHTHPVLTMWKNRINDLEDKLAKATELDTQRVQRLNELRNEKWAYESKVERVLKDAWEDYDHDTIRHIASELDISLTITKQFEVNVLFTLDVEVEIDEADNIDPEWFEFAVNESAVVDYSTDVITCKEIS